MFVFTGTDNGGLVYVGVFAENLVSRMSITLPRIKRPDAICKAPPLYCRYVDICILSIV